MEEIELAFLKVFAVLYTSLVLMTCTLAVAVAVMVSLKVGVTGTVETMEKSACQEKR